MNGIYKYHIKSKVLFEFADIAMLRKILKNLGCPVDDRWPRCRCCVCFREQTPEGQLFVVRLLHRATYPHPPITSTPKQICNLT
jgi:hypothetical protein